MKPKLNNHWVGKSQSYNDNSAEFSQFMASKSIDIFDINGGGIVGGHGGTPIQLIPRQTLRGPMEEGK